MKKPDRIDRLTQVVEQLAEVVATMATVGRLPRVASFPAYEEPSHGGMVSTITGPGRSCRFPIRSLVDLIGEREVTWTQWQTDCVTKLGMSARTFERLSRIAVQAGLVNRRYERTTFYTVAKDTA
jgi:hypothetical protein